MVININIDTSGVMSFVWSDAAQPLLDCGVPQIKRASHVEPNADGTWSADLSPVGGPTFGPHAHRRDALDAEVEWLHAHHGRAVTHLFGGA